MQKSFSGECDLAMRELIATVAGPRSWGDTRQSWLARAARKANLSYRQVHALWYGEIKDPNHRSARLMRDAALRFGNLADRLEIIDPDFHQFSIGEFRALAERVGNLERGAAASAGARQIDAEGLEE